jgi:hypothetical protein
MGNFVWTKEHDVHMYAKFGYFTFDVFVQLNTPGFDL